MSINREQSQRIKIVRDLSKNKVAQGTPEQIADVKSSYTGNVMKEMLRE